jgi:hypothetical protein
MLQNNAVYLTSPLVVSCFGVNVIGALERRNNRVCQLRRPGILQVQDRVGGRGKKLYQQRSSHSQE